MIKIQKYGWRPSLGDARDHRLEAPAHFEADGLLDLESIGPPVYDQGELGSCTYNGIAAQGEFWQIRLGLRRFAPSRLFGYFNELNLEGMLPNDVGAEPRHGIWGATGNGFPDEALWRYDISKFAERAPQSVYHEAAKQKVTTGYQLLSQDNSYHIRHALTLKKPPGLGFSVCASFEGDKAQKRGIWDPKVDTESVIGGHYGVIVACALNSKLPMTLVNGAVLKPHVSGGWVKFRNSWGTSSGINGHIWMPLGFVLDERVCSDQWAF